MILLLATLVIVIPAQRAYSQKEPNEPAGFQPPEVVSAGDVAYPPLSVAFGTVVLEVSLSDSGAVKSVNALRPIESLTPAAIDAVRSWKYKPARLKGKAMAAHMTVAVTFNPAVVNPANVPLPPLVPSQDEENRSPLVPPDVVSAAFSEYPVNGVAFGSVVLEATVDEGGAVKDIKALREIASLTSQALQALKKWEFSPAELDGQRVPAKVAVAFVYKLPVHSVPH